MAFVAVNNQTFAGKALDACVPVLLGKTAREELDEANPYGSFVGTECGRECR